MDKNTLQKLNDVSLLNTPQIEIIEKNNISLQLGLEDNNSNVVGYISIMVRTLDTQEPIFLEKHEFNTLLELLDNNREKIQEFYKQAEVYRECLEVLTGQERAI